LYRDITQVEASVEDTVEEWVFTIWLDLLFAPFAKDLYRWISIVVIASRILINQILILYSKRAKMEQRRIAGKTAKREGDLFERILEQRALINCYNLIRIPDGCKTVRRGQKTVLKRVKSPFDFILQKPGGKNIFFDAKSKEGDKISYSNFFSNESTASQVLTLLESENFGQKSGFMVWFRGADKIVFILASDVATMKPRTSFSRYDGIKLGSLNNLDFEPLF